jgi:hypothetical protein
MKSTAVSMNPGRIDPDFSIVDSSVLTTWIILSMSLCSIMRGPMGIMFLNVFSFIPGLLYVDRESMTHHSAYTCPINTMALFEVCGYHSRALQCSTPGDSGSVGVSSAGMQENGHLKRLRHPTAGWRGGH